MPQVDPVRLQGVGTSRCTSPPGVACRSSWGTWRDAVKIDPVARARARCACAPMRMFPACYIIAVDVGSMGGSYYSSTAPRSSVTATMSVAGRIVGSGHFFFNITQRVKVRRRADEVVAHGSSEGVDANEPPADGLSSVVRFGASPTVQALLSGTLVSTRKAASVPCEGFCRTQTGHENRNMVDCHMHSRSPFLREYTPIYAD